MAYTFTPINFTGDTFTQALGINNGEEITGFHGMTVAQSFLLTLPSTFTPFIFPAAAQTTSVGINTPGNVVGFYLDAGGTTHGFERLANGTFATQDEANTAFNQLLGINDSGQEVGYSSLMKDGQTLQLAYLRQANGSYTTLDNAGHTLDLPANANSQATGLDNNGDVVGFFMPTSTTSNGFILPKGATKAIALEFPGSTFTQALGINNHGQIVGFYNDANGATHGFIFSVGNSNDAVGNAWVSVDVPSSTGTTINGINDKGEIVGFDTTANGTSGFESPIPNVNMTDTTTGGTWQQSMTPYTGPLTLTSEYIDINPHNLNMTAITPNVFLHSGSGEDALKALSGVNVLDGGTNSNFLTDGSGMGDTDFVDARGLTANVWSTMNNFHSSDSATVFGVTANDFKNWVDGQGATGFTGLTTHIPIGTNGLTASLTLAGFTTTDLSNGRLSVSFGNETDGTPFMLVHAN